MVRNSANTDRDLHQHYLDLGVIDASQDVGWRRLLFAAPLYQEFTIDTTNSEGLPKIVALGIQRYGLEYLVCRIPQSETTFDEPGWDGCIFFRFRARRYPDIVSFSANNPDVI